MPNYRIIVFEHLNYIYGHANAASNGRRPFQPMEPIMANQMPLPASPTPEEIRAHLARARHLRSQTLMAMLGALFTGWRRPAPVRRTADVAAA